eukprot:5121086-Karenia_brevis.AAC.1
MLRDALRVRESMTAATRRNDMKGIEHGINKEATSAYLNSSKVPLADKALLRVVQAGGLWTKDRAFRAGLEGTNLCRHCEMGAVEDHAHMWWQCPAW